MISAAKLGGRISNDTGQHVTIARMEMPVVRTSGSSACSRLNSSRIRHSTIDIHAPTGYITSRKASASARLTSVNNLTKSSPSTSCNGLAFSSASRAMSRFFGSVSRSSPLSLRDGLAAFSPEARARWQPVLRQSQGKDWHQRQASDFRSVDFWDC